MLNILKANPEVIVPRVCPIDIDFQITLVVHVVTKRFRMAFAVKFESEIVACDSVVAVLESLWERKVDPGLVMGAHVGIGSLFLKQSRLALMVEAQDWLRMWTYGEESALGAWCWWWHFLAVVSILTEDMNDRKNKTLKFS
jgi:hypothetical protein